MGITRKTYYHVECEFPTCKEVNVGLSLKFMRDFDGWDIAAVKHYIPWEKTKAFCPVHALLQEKLEGDSKVDEIE